MAVFNAFFLVCTAAIIVLASGDCLNGWTRFDDSCYRFNTTKLDFPKARFECEKHDAFLVVIETQQENTNIHALVKELNLATSVNIWIGLSDARQEGVWVREDSKQNATYFDWGHNEPNQHASTTQQDCVMLYGKEGHKWADYICGNALPFLCERPLHA